MATSQLISGITSLAIDGSNYSIKEGASFRPSVVTREDVVSINGDIFYKEVPIAGEIKATFLFVDGVSVDSFNGMNDVTVNIICANGTTITGNNMWTTETQTANVNEGEFEVTFHGPSVTSVTS